MTLISMHEFCAPCDVHVGVIAIKGFSRRGLCSGNGDSEALACTGKP